LYYRTSDNKIVFVSAQGTPGMDEYEVSLINPLPRPSANETVVFRNGQWSRQDVDSGRPILADTDKSEKRKEVLELRTGSLPDVYYVYEPATGKSLGPARVRSLKESKSLRQMFKEKSVDSGDNTKSVQLTCVFEEEFMKWRPLFD